jgi:hypothetical protein
VAGAGVVVVVAFSVVAIFSSASFARTARRARAAGNSTTYQDPSSDTSGPDITAITVSNDDTGDIHFRVDVPNTTSAPNGGGFALFIDVNEDGAADYEVSYPAGGGNPTLLGGRVSDLAFHGSWSSGATFDLNRSFIGADSVNQIQFKAYTLYNDTNYYYDRAPDSS